MTNSSAHRSRARRSSSAAQGRISSSCVSARMSLFFASPMTTRPSAMAHRSTSRSARWPARPAGQIRLRIAGRHDASHVGIHRERECHTLAGAVAKIEQMWWMPVYDVRRPG